MATTSFFGSWAATLISGIFQGLRFAIVVEEWLGCALVVEAVRMVRTAHVDGVTVVVGMVLGAGVEVLAGAALAAND